jgi:curved DNA-binding protein CbpA
MQDYYAVLGLTPAATSEEIKDAYRRKVREHHPDANPGRRHEAEIQVKAVFEAYAVLSNSEKRRLHDLDLATHAHESARMAARSGIPNAPVVEPATPAHTAPPPLCLVRRVREVLQISITDMAHQLGLSEAMLQQLESRDGIPQGTVQLRTFTHLVDMAASKLDSEGRNAEATGVRSALQRKKNQRAIFR